VHVAHRQPYHVRAHERGGLVGVGNLPRLFVPHHVDQNHPDAATLQHLNELDLFLQKRPNLLRSSSASSTFTLSIFALASGVRSSIVMGLDVAGGAWVGGSADGLRGGSSSSGS
jgi:hypothetical protein